MRIRTQLILASFFLAVIPLAAIVTYSYHSSRRAIEAADRREAQRATQQMDRRLASIRADLDQRLTLVSALPVADAQTGDVGSSIATAMGGASLVESLEFKPFEMPERPEVAERPEPKEPSEPPEQPEPGEKTVIVRVDDAQAVAPMLIDLPGGPRFPRFVMSEKQRELLDEIGKLGKQLGNQQLSRDEREDIRRELTAAQEELQEVIGEDSKRRNEQFRQVQEARRQRTRAMDRQTPAAPPAPAPVPAPSATPVIAATPQIEIRGLTPQELQRIKVAEEKATLILGRNFKAPVRKEGEVVGQITPRINPERVVRQLLGGATADRDEIPFAIDRKGNVYTRNPAERTSLDRSGIVDRVRQGKSVRDIRGWVVSMTTDDQSGLRIGVARPVGEVLTELRKTAGRNFVLGMGLIAFALIGIVPLSNHLTRDVKVVTDGAERIAQGDLMTRLPVKNDNELGQLARAFNRMAEDLSLHQQKIVDQEVKQRLMNVEYERKSVELEDARRFQLSMLPKQVPQHESYDVAVHTRTATEVGGDYYDFHLAENGTLSVTIGDATGHGAKAGTMVTVIKTLFAGDDGSSAPAEFLRAAAETIKRMELGRMSMALSLARLEDRVLTLAAAGMPPVLIHRAANDKVDEIALSATPLGTLGMDYRETSVDLQPGDTVLFLTDGFPELMNDAGQQLGYPAALDAFAAAARAGSASAVIASLTEIVSRWHGDAPPNDDVTFVVVRVQSLS